MTCGRFGRRIIHVWPPALSSDSVCCSAMAGSRTPDLELLLMLSTSPVPLSSPVLHLRSAVFESFLGWGHLCLCASAKQKCLSQRLQRIFLLHRNKSALLVWTRSLLHKRAPRVLVFAVYFARAGYVSKVCIPGDFSLVQALHIQRFLDYGITDSFSSFGWHLFNWYPALNSTAAVSL